MSSTRDIITLAILFISLYFEVFMLITYIERRKILHGRVKDTLAAHADLPSVTIIVPCYNEQYTAGKTIHSLLGLEYPADKLRIVAVNDGSTDGTREALEVFRGNPQIEIIHKENGGKHTALNLAISQATTELVGCLDADSYVVPDALMRLVRQFQNPETMAVVPSLHIHEPKTIIQIIQKTEYIIGVFLRSIQGELNAIYVTPGPFSIIRKSVFDKIGLYKKAYNTEDMELALRMQANGMKIASAQDAVVYTSSPRSVKALYTQRVRWTSGFLSNITREYRFMLFKPSYGHMGGFILPAMLVSAFSIIFIISTFAYDIVRFAHSLIVRFESIGMHGFSWSMPRFDLFFFHTSPVIFSGMVAICTVIAFIFIGSKLSRGNTPRIRDIATYMFLYSFIAPFWVGRSLINLAFGKQAAWR